MIIVIIFLGVVSIFYVSLFMYVHIIFILFKDKDAIQFHDFNIQKTFFYYFTQFTAVVM